MLSKRPWLCIFSERNVLYRGSFGYDDSGSGVGCWVGCDCSTDIPPIGDNHIVSHAASIADPSTLLTWGNIGCTKKGKANFNGII